MDRLRKRELLFEKVLEKAVKMYKRGELSLSSDEYNIVCSFTIDGMTFTIRPFPLERLNQDKLVTVQRGECVSTFNTVHPDSGWPFIMFGHKKVCKFADYLYEHRPIEWPETSWQQIKSGKDSLKVFEAT